MWLEMNHLFLCSFPFVGRDSSVLVTRLITNLKHDGLSSRPHGPATQSKEATNPFFKKNP